MKRREQEEELSRRRWWRASGRDEGAVVLCRNEQRAAVVGRGGGEEEERRRSEGCPDWRFEAAVAGGEWRGREDAAGRRTELFGPGWLEVEVGAEQVGKEGGGWS